MPNVNRRQWLTASGANLSAAGEPTAQASGGETKWKTISPRDVIKNRHLPNVVLTTHEGKKVRFYDDLMKDKIVVINMMYATCEGVCPRITSNLQQVQKFLGDRVGRDIFFYSITLKPEVDTPAVLKKHVAMHKIKPGWTFLTGAPADIELLRRKLGFSDPDPEVDKDKANHIGNVRYGNEALMLWAAAPGLSKASAIAESIKWVDWPKEEAATKVKGDRK
ncbi:MAG: SCO family protein [Acidobacteria bacterium]|nr:SCO family protein [Acidobacteriota bacterium]